MKLTLLLAFAFTLAPILSWGKFEMYKFYSLLIGYLFISLLWIKQLEHSKMSRIGLVLLSLGIITLQTFVYLIIMWMFIH